MSGLSSSGMISGIPLASASVANLGGNSPQGPHAELYAGLVGLLFFVCLFGVLPAVLNHVLRWQNHFSWEVYNRGRWSARCQVEEAVEAHIMERLRWLSEYGPETFGVNEVLYTQWLQDREFDIIRIVDKYLHTPFNRLKPSLDALPPEVYHARLPWDEKWALIGEFTERAEAWRLARLGVEELARGEERRDGGNPVAAQRLALWLDTHQPVRDRTRNRRAAIPYMR